MPAAPLRGLDLGIYPRAVLLLVRNPSIVVVPLLMSVIGVLVARLIEPYGGGPLMQITGGIAGLILLLLQFFGLGAACTIADEAWRRGRASFDRGWSETQRRGGDILFAAIGVTLLLSVAQYIAQLLGIIGNVVVALVVYGLIWAVPAVAVGGIPGGASIQASIDRVRANPLSAAIATLVSVVLAFIGAPLLAVQLADIILPAHPELGIVYPLLSALFQSIAFGYAALVLTKTYTDAAFAPPRR